MSYRARKVDLNQELIRKALERAGASVDSLASVGGGIPDLLVGCEMGNVLVEVKNPNVPRLDRQLTPAQLKWHARWRGPKFVVETPEDALRVCGLTLSPGALQLLRAELGVPSPPPQVAKKRGPFRRKGKGTVSPPPEISDVGRTHTNHVDRNIGKPGISMRELLLHELDEQEREVLLKKPTPAFYGRGGSR